MRAIRAGFGTAVALALGIGVGWSAGSAVAGEPEHPVVEGRCAGAVEVVTLTISDSSQVTPGSQAAPESTRAASDSSHAPPAAAEALLKQKEFPHPDAALMQRLRAGGFLIVFRHGITDWAQKDLDGENFEDRATQRNLSKEGDAQAARIGKAIADLRIPIGTVLSSPMWRCRDTAQIAFGHHQPVPELFRRGPEYRATRMVMLSTVPGDKKNTALVTHQDLLIPIIEGLRRDQLREGDAFIVEPLGEGQFKVLAQVTPEDWERLAADYKPADVAKNGKAKPPKSKKTTQQ